MGSYRSKEDEVLKISTSVFVTNFPDQFSAKDLWNTCKNYGHVVNAYIPNRRSKVVIHRGKVVWVRAKEVPGWVPDFVEDNEEQNESDDESYEDEPNVGDLKNIENLEGDSDGDVVFDTKFDEETHIKNDAENSVGQNNVHSEDPFNLYEILNKKRDDTNKDLKSDDSLRYPPGFTPRDNKDDSGDHSYGSNENIEQILWWIGLAQKAKKDWVNEICVNNKVNFLSLQETKMKSIEIFCIKSCWGNYTLDYVYSASVGNSGGILCVWDPKMFKKLNATVSDYFVMVRGDWVSNDKKLLIISVVEVVVKGDFKELRNKDERFWDQVFNDARLQSLEVAQKVKIKWAIEGDENSKYFHGVINKKRSQHNIRGILANGTWIESPALVKGEFFSHFKNRFDQPHVTRLHIDMNFSNKINSDQVADLECDVSKEEIKRAVWDCGIDKSPGPDGFMFGLYRRYWNIIENDVVDAVTCFFLQGYFPKGSNSSFVTLIPKTLNANMVKDFRPISLIGSMYKIISKILANRLVMVLGDLVNEVQYAFVADRQILDGPFILNELVQWCKKKKKNSLVFKVDFEKAYDSVRWDYLDDVLRKFGFGEKWCMWIQNYLRSSRGSVIVNGSPTEEFQFFKGLKQGDPLSPFLFILVMETLQISFQRVVDAGLFKGIMLAHSLHLSHMFYVDDAIFMGQWSESNIDTIVQVLECFHHASGLRINMSKSKLLGISVEANKVEQAAAKIGCTICNTPKSGSQWNVEYSRALLYGSIAQDMRTTTKRVV
ncbi:RNA-directed DNA polymerase, eukaryota [Tanacetum coccineum]|uniref:RNA-directed DNA polymerase, eukaryota n=1 Tax=Tanacetum coccineum TaxID=301880 RepID=A0ABQ5BJE6_9ASTR